VRALLVVLCVAAAVPAAAQVRRPPPRPIRPPAISLRPFVLFSEQRFAAQQSFDAVFGQTVQPFFGGGLSAAFANGVFVDVAVSRFKKTGQRAFFFEGQSFPLGIPLTVTETPVEVTAGGRFRVTPNAVAYGGGGIGSYGYQESSDFDSPFSARHVGYLVVGGIEVRVSRWIGVSGDAQYSHVTGIVGAGGISKDTGETDLGGIGARFRLILGR
jgi:hypothetical protein